MQAVIPLGIGIVAAAPINNAIEAVGTVAKGYFLKTFEVDSFRSNEIFLSLNEALEKHVREMPFITAQVQPSVWTIGVLQNPDACFGDVAVLNNNAVQRIIAEVVETSKYSTMEPVFQLGYGSWKINMRKASGETWYLYWKRERQETSFANGPVETIRLSFSSEHWPAFEEFIKSSVALRDRRLTNCIRVYYPNIAGEWSSQRELPPRKLDTLILPDEIKRDVLADVAWFLSSTGKRFYTQKGLNYRRGYLFHGQPGAGKSSLAFAIASEFGLRVFYILLSDGMLDDRTLAELLRKVPPRSVIVMEDIDSIYSSQENDHIEMDHEIRSSNITRCGLLNALDGIGSYVDSILIMTTNYIERLEPALLRNGRTDKQYHFRSPSEEQIRQYLAIHIPSLSEQSLGRVLQVGIDNMASLQELVIEVENKSVLQGLTADQVIDTWLQRFLQRGTL